MFLDRFGSFIGSNRTPRLVNGRWGLAIHNFNNGHAQVFLFNALSGSISRFDITSNSLSGAIVATKTTVIGPGFNHRVRRH